MEKLEKKEIDILLNIIEEKTGYTLNQLKSGNRKQELAYARRAFLAISRKLSGLSLKKIGKIINRNHTTVIYSITQHNNEIDINEEYSKTYHSINKSLEILFVIEQGYNPEYMKKQMESLTIQRNLLNDRIKEYQQKIKKQIN